MKSNFDRLAYYLAVAHAVAVVHFSATAHPVEFVVYFVAVAHVLAVVPGANATVHFGGVSVIDFIHVVVPVASFGMSGHKPDSL